MEIFCYIYHVRKDPQPPRPRVVGTQTRLSSHNAIPSALTQRLVSFTHACKWVKKENNLYVYALASWYCCELRVGMPNLPGRVA